MSGHIFSKIPSDLWLELQDLKVDVRLNWDKTIGYICDIIPRPKKQKNYQLYYPDGDMVTINLKVSLDNEKKFKKFSNAFDSHWQSLDYLVEKTKEKRKTFIN